MGIRTVIAALSALAVAGCITGDAVRTLEPGVSRSEVISIMGRPDGVRSQDGYEIMTYANRLMSGWSWDRTDYFVILKDGNVTEYGNGEVRTRPETNTVILVNPFTE